MPRAKKTIEPAVMNLEPPTTPAEPLEGGFVNKVFSQGFSDVGPSERLDEAFNKLLSSQVKQEKTKRATRRPKTAKATPPVEFSGQYQDDEEGDVEGDVEPEEPVRRPKAQVKRALKKTSKASKPMSESQAKEIMRLLEEERRLKEIEDAKPKRPRGRPRKSEI